MKQLQFVAVAVAAWIFNGIANEEFRPPQKIKDALLTTEKQNINISTELDSTNLELNLRQLLTLVLGIYRCLGYYL